MSTNKNPKLPLTDDERVNLRRSKVKLSEIHHLEFNYLAQILCTSLDRAREIKGLAAFQYVPSIGPKLAEKIVHILNIYSLEEIKGENGAELFDKLERKMGVWTDSCVEDQIRCIIYFANNSNSNKKWFEFTEERKWFRQRHGYPKSRPEKAWYDTP